MWNFNPRSPRGGATKPNETLKDKDKISIHAPHEGERQAIRPLFAGARRFQSTLPTRGSDSYRVRSCPEFVRISIHAPHEGERQKLRAAYDKAIDISIHAPHEGERRGHKYMLHPHNRFQSTLPTRGSDSYSIFAILSITISIHAPHEGERRQRYFTSLRHVLFQSTLPTRGSDEVYRRRQTATYHFNPRSPRGGATYSGRLQHSANQAFQSTLPTRGSDLKIIKLLKR